MRDGARIAFTRPRKFSPVQQATTPGWLRAGRVSMREIRAWA